MIDRCQGLCAERGPSLEPNALFRAGGKWMCGRCVTWRLDRRHAERWNSQAEVQDQRRRFMERWRELDERIFASPGRDVQRSLL